MIEVSLNSYSLPLFIAFIIAITFGFLLLLKPGNNKKADRFLAALMFIVAFWNATLLILELGIYQYIIGIIWVPFSYTLALGPCFYFYVRYLTDSNLSFKGKVWPHFIPVLFEVILFLVQVFQGIPQRKAYFQTELFSILDPVVNALAIMSLLIYGFYARRLMNQYHDWVKNNYSHYHKYTLNWLVRFCSIFLLFLTLWLFYLVVDYFFYDYQLTFADYYPFHLALAVISIWLSIEAYSKPEIEFSDSSLISTKQALTSEDSLKRDSEEHTEIEAMASWLASQIEDNRLYLDPELSLKSLAVILDIHPNLTSKIINEGLGKSFSDCINGYRVKAVVKMLENPAHNNDTLLAIAFDCGFNSKTTFNRIFKKYKDLTPAQYRRQQ